MLFFWDFGGQEIYYGIHEIFFTNKTIYLLVVDGRQQYSNIDHWILSIRTFAGDAPIILVASKTDLHSVPLDVKFYTSQKNIFAVTHVSVASNIGFNNLRHDILNAAATIEPYQALFPASWNNVINDLTSLKQNCIDYDYFKKLCIQNDIINSETRDTLSNYLNDSSFIVHFKNISLFQTIVLNPVWLANGFLTILSADKISDGYISSNEIKSLFTNKGDEYPIELLSYIISLMAEFELLLKLDEDSYLIPSLLPLASTIDYSRSDFNLIYRYDYLPKNVFNRIVVRLSTSLTAKSIWSNRLSIVYQGCNAIIQNNISSNEILIKISGEKKNELLFLLRSNIDSINLSYPYIKSAILIQGQESDLLPEAKANLVFDDIDLKKKSELRPIEIFVSYSHKDIRFKNELVTHISPLVRLEEVKIWEDGKLIPGTDWKSEVVKKLRDSDITLCLVSSDFIASEFCYSVELKEALKFHERKQKLVIPIIIRDCVWKGLSLGQIQGVPKKPVKSHSNRDKAWTEVVESISSSLDYIRKIKYG